MLTLIPTLDNRIGLRIPLPPSSLKQWCVSLGPLLAHLISELRLISDSLTLPVWVVLLDDHLLREGLG